MGEEQCPLLLLLPEIWVHPWVLKHIPQVTVPEQWIGHPPWRDPFHHTCGVQGSLGVQQQGEDKLAAPSRVFLLQTLIYKGCFMLSREFGGWGIHCTALLT